MIKYNFVLPFFSKYRLTIYSKSIAERPPNSGFFLGIRIVIGAYDDIKLFVLATHVLCEEAWEQAISVTDNLSLKENIDYRPMLIGDGPDFDQIQSNSQHKIYFHFVGQIVNPVPIIKENDMSICPGTFAGVFFPLFVIECLNKSFPVFATYIGEIQSIMKTDKGDIFCKIFSLRKDVYLTLDRMLNSKQYLCSCKQTWAKLKIFAAKSVSCFNIKIVF